MGAEPTPSVRRRARFAVLLALWTAVLAPPPGAARQAGAAEERMFITLLAGSSYLRTVLSLASRPRTTVSCRRTPGTFDNLVGGAVSRG